MRLRSFLWAVVLTAGFIYLTSKADWSLRRLVAPIQSTGRQWSEPEVARTAAFGSDEQNNIDIYKVAHNSTVGITTVVYQRGFFFEVYPAKDSGSGFIISQDGRIRQRIPIGKAFHQRPVSPPTVHISGALRQ